MRLYASQNFFKGKQKKIYPHPDPLPEKGEGVFPSPSQGEGAK